MILANRKRRQLSLKRKGVAWIRGTNPVVPPPPQLPESELQRWAPAPGKIGICCSGGGVRSAAYNLGALQELQSAGVLRRATYVAGVSGGSYISAALSIIQMSGDRGDPAKGFDDLPPFARGSPEERHLRNHSSYLAYGLKGKLRLLFALLVGLLLNLVLLLLALVLIARPLGLLATVFRPALVVAVEGETPATASGSLEGSLWWLIAGCGLLAVSFALLSASLRLGDQGQAIALRFFKVSLAVGAATFVVAFGLPSLLVGLRRLFASSQQQGSSDITTLLGVATAVGIPPLVMGFLRSVWAAAPATGLQRLVRFFATPRFAAALVAPAIALTMFLILYNDAASTGLDVTQWWWIGGALGGIIVFYLLLDPTASSMHPFYRRRLCSAFALRRLGRDRAEERPYEQRVPLSVSQPPDWPELVVCAAANISDEGATPPGRGADTFTFTSRFVGGTQVGYVPTADMEAVLTPKRARDITLPAAVAMSGAALSPSMGKMTSASHRFLLALGNARLGVWLPNPRYVAENPRSRWGRPRMTWLLREMRGLNTEMARYLYVTDGGHYENLGLVELLRRGCTEIYCFDATGDPPGSFSTIGQAIALARSELNVDLPLDLEELRPESADAKFGRGSHIAADFVYPPERPGQKPVTGTLIYVKAAVTADAPWDVKAYRDRDKSFPSNPTIDQLYTDERFEAYRALGAHTARTALTMMRNRKTRAFPFLSWGFHTKLRRLSVHEIFKR